MKDPIEMIRQKEREILRVKQEIEALKLAARIIENEESPSNDPKVDRRLLRMP